jgi:hypothetical protein
MTLPENPYKASDSALPFSDADAVPGVVKFAIAAYVLVYLMQATVIVSSDLGAMRSMMLVAVVVKGAFAATIATALWWRQQWARIWIAFATVFNLFGIIQLLGPTRHAMEEVSIASHVLRILMACMLFLPAARFWFARRRA